VIFSHQLLDVLRGAMQRHLQQRQEAMLGCVDVPGETDSNLKRAVAIKRQASFSTPAPALRKQ
jgi:hypothetical protein